MGRRAASPTATKLTSSSSWRSTMFFSLLASLCALCLMLFVVLKHLNHPISFQQSPLHASDHRSSNNPNLPHTERAGERSGWLWFAADSSEPSSTGVVLTASGKRSERQAPSGGYKWAAASLLDDFGASISPFELLNFDADQRAAHNSTPPGQKNNYSARNHNSKTQRDLRDTMRRLHERDTPTRLDPLATSSPIETAKQANNNNSGVLSLTSSIGKRERDERKREKYQEVEASAQIHRRHRRRKRRAGNERGKPILNEFSFPANLVQGMRFVLMCQVLDGEPPIQIKWFKDNSDLAATLLASSGAGAAVANQDNRPQGAAQMSAGGLDSLEMISNDELGSSLLFRRVKQQHGGNYTCLASNHLGSASYSSLMTVKVPPGWHVEPQDQESIMGEQITIDCQASGNPNPFIRWKFASAVQFDKILSPSSSSLVSQADLLQGQNPMLVVAQGQLQATGTITSNQQQQHSTYNNNNQFKLINSNHHVQTLENGSLIIRQASKEHEGLYLCEADNGVEPSLVKQMKLIVHKQVHFVDDIQVILQQQQHSRPPLEANANGGSIISKDHSVSSSSTAPQPTNQLTAQSIKAVRLPQNSSLVRLVCSPLGDAPIQLEWLKDGRLIHTHSSGPAPSSSSSSSNEIQDIPASSQQQQQTNEHSSTIGRYHVSTRWSYVAGGGGGGRAPVGLESELLLTNLNRHDAGLYTCAARNAFGQSERKLRLIVQEPPEPPTLVDVAHISSRAIALRWSAPFDGNSPILKYVIEYRRQVSAPSQDSAMSQQQQQQQGDMTPVGRVEKLMPISRLQQGPTGPDSNAIVVSQLLASNGGVNGPQVQHTVHDLEPLTRYSMQVIAINALGQSKPSVALSLRTEEEVPATVPNLVEAAVLSSRSIKLRWTISYALEHELIDGFFIGYRSFDSAASSLLLDNTQQPPVSSDAAGNPILGASPTSPAATTNNPKQFTYKTIRLTNQHLQQEGDSGHHQQLDQNGGTSSSSRTPILSPVASVTKSMPVGALLKFAAASNVKDRPVATQEEVAYVMSTFEHVISGLDRNTEYTFLIQCFNKKGAGPTSDPVAAKTLMSDPPEKLVVLADDLSETSLRVSWHFPGESGMHAQLLARPGIDSITGARQPATDSVDGFLLTFAKVAPRSALAARKSTRTSQQPPDSPAARIVQQPTGSGNQQQQQQPPVPTGQLLDSQQWQAIQLAPQQRTHVLKQLECGSWYALKISAFNRQGKGEPSDLVTVATRGKAPLAPARSQFLATNSTQVRLHLGAWHDGGCAIEKFIVQYRARTQLRIQGSPGQEPWILVSNNILRDQQSVLIRDLAPATTYELLVGAQNHVGLSEAKYRFTTLDSEGKQVVAGGGSSFLGGNNDLSDDGDTDDSNSFVDYSDDSSVRRESYGSGPEGSIYLQPNAGPIRWLQIARHVLNSPLTLLLTFCVFLVLLGLLIFHRFNAQASAHQHHHHNNNQGNYHPGGGGGNSGAAAKINSTVAPNHLQVGRCSIDGLVDGEPPALSSSSAATDSPARVNMTEGGNLRLVNGGYAPLDCYGNGTYCSGQVAPPSGDQQHYGGGAHQPECFAAATLDNGYPTAVSQQQRQQMGYYPQHGPPPASSIYGTTTGSHDQHCLMQMLLMSPGQQQQQQQQQQDDCASASALATMARQKAGASMKPMSGVGGAYNNLTLGRQLLDMQRAQAAAAIQEHNQQASGEQ